MFELFLIILVVIAIIALPKARLFGELGKTVNNMADTASLINEIWADGNIIMLDKWQKHKGNQLK